MTYLVCMAALVFTACEGPNLFTGAPPAVGHQLAGTYILETVNGEELPVLWDEADGVTMDLVGGTIRLNTDETFVDRLVFELTEDGETVEEEDLLEGSYSWADDTVTMEPTVGGPYTLTVEGNTLTLQEGSLRLVYRR